MSLTIQPLRSCVSCHALVPYGNFCPKCKSTKFELVIHYKSTPYKKKKYPHPPGGPKQYNLF